MESCVIRTVYECRTNPKYGFDSRNEMGLQNSRVTNALNNGFNLIKKIMHPVLWISVKNINDVILILDYKLCDLTMMCIFIYVSSSTFEVVKMLRFSPSRDIYDRKWI